MLLVINLKAWTTAMFFLHQSGVLVAVIRGANSPVLGRAIVDLLAHEHKVLEGAAERKEVAITTYHLQSKRLQHTLAM